MTDYERLPPHSREAEAAVLGSMLKQNACIVEVAATIGAEDFYSDAHQKIYRAVMAVWGRGAPVDAETLADELHRQKFIDDVGGYPYLGELLGCVATAANAEWHARIVREKSVQRQLIHAGTEIVRDAHDGSSRAEEMLEQAERKVFAIGASAYTPQIVLLSQAISEVHDLWDARVSGDGGRGLATGFLDLDAVLGGLRDGELTIIGARPSMGKTALGAQIGFNIAKAGKSVMFISLEQSRLELTERLLALDGHVDLFKLKRGLNLGEEEYRRLALTSSELSHLKFWIDDTPNMTFMRIASTARRIKSRKGLDLLCVDYLQLIEPDQADRKASRQEQVSNISRRLKLLARDLKIPMLVLAQVNRGLEDRADQRPRLSDLRESGAIEQDADVVMFIHRPGLTDPSPENEGVAEILVRKQRNGPTGELKLVFQKQFTRFENWAGDFMTSYEIPPTPERVVAP